jgi:hypothetical protein
MSKIYVFANGKAHYTNNEDMVGIEIDGEAPVKMLEATEENLKLYFDDETIAKINELKNMIQSNQR